jgi:hypothetical protein
MLQYERKACKYAQGQGGFLDGGADVAALVCSRADVMIGNGAEVIDV